MSLFLMILLHHYSNFLTYQKFDVRAFFCQFFLPFFSQSSKKICFSWYYCTIISQLFLMILLHHYSILSYITTIWCESIWEKKFLSVTIFSCQFLKKFYFSWYYILHHYLIFSYISKIWCETIFLSVFVK